jgi:hypothetical protein
MKTAIILAGLLAWVSCIEDDKLPKDVVVLESNAEWVNMLAADGCSWHFEVPSGDSLLYYVPDDASLKLIDKALGKKESSYSFTKTHIKYSLTGRKKGVMCGWGATPSFDEIEVYKVEKK